MTTLKPDYNLSLLVMMHKQVLDLYVGVLGQQRGLDLLLHPQAARFKQVADSLKVVEQLPPLTALEQQLLQPLLELVQKIEVVIDLSSLEQTEVINEGDRVVSSDVIAFMRSRNIEFTGRKFKPRTRVYGFFDGTNVNNFVVPKLLEIRMISGSFSVGETVTGAMPTSATPTVGNSTPTPFRVAQSNHKVWTNQCTH